MRWYGAEAAWRVLLCVLEMRLRNKNTKVVCRWRVASTSRRQQLMRARYMGERRRSRGSIDAFKCNEYD